MPRSPKPGAAPKSIRAADVKRKPAPRKPRGSVAVITLPKTPEPLIAPTLPPTPPPPRAASQHPAAKRDQCRCCQESGLIHGARIR